MNEHGLSKNPPRPDCYKNAKGYYMRLCPGHPEAAFNDGYVPEHRLVMEEYLAGPLQRGEAVHHRNRKKWDNSPANLLLCPSNDLHLRFHQAEDAGDQEMVAAYEGWFTSRMEERRGASASTATYATTPPTRAVVAPPALSHATLPPRSTPAVGPPLFALVEELGRIPNEAERRTRLEEILVHVDRRTLATAIAGRIRDATAGIASRFIWALAELGPAGAEAGGVALHVEATTAVVPGVPENTEAKRWNDILSGRILAPQITEGLRRGVSPAGVGKALGVPEEIVVQWIRLRAGKVPVHRRVPRRRA